MTVAEGRQRRRTGYEAGEPRLDARWTKRAVPRTDSRRVQPPSVQRARRGERQRVRECCGRRSPTWTSIWCASNGASGRARDRRASTCIRQRPMLATGRDKWPRAKPSSSRPGRTSSWRRARICGAGETSCPPAQSSRRGEASNTASLLSTDDFDVSHIMGPWSILLLPAV
jgi:hypothetical protein